MKAKIYTKTGDRGQTSLVGGARVAKTDIRIEAYGGLDELNSTIGLIRAFLGRDHGATDIWSTRVEARLQSVQNALFNIGSRLACADAKLRDGLPDVTDATISALEADMDEWEKDLPPLRAFILPGGSELGARAHLSRTVCRRAERAVLRLAESDGDAVGAGQLIYLNRLSDWLFLLARKFNAAAGAADLPWSKD